VTSEAIGTGGPTITNVVSLSARVGARGLKTLSPSHPAASPLQPFHPSWNSAVNTIFHDDYKTEDEEEEEEHEVEIIEEDPLEVPAAGEDAVPSGTGSSEATEASSEPAEDRAASGGSGSRPVSPVPAVPTKTSGGEETSPVPNTSAILDGDSITEGLVSQGPIIIPQRMRIPMPLYERTTATAAAVVETTATTEQSNADKLLPLAAVILQQVCKKAMYR
jgi:hypothetical protein